MKKLFTMVLVAISSCCLFLACEGEDSSDQLANPLSNTYWEMEYDVALSGNTYKRYLDFQDDNTVIYGDTGGDRRYTGTYKVLYDGYANFYVSSENGAFYLRKATFTNRTLVLWVRKEGLDLQYTFFKK